LAHTIRFGLLAQHASESLDMLTLAFPADADGKQNSTTPLWIPDASGNHAWEAGAPICKTSGR